MNIMKKIKAVFQLIRVRQYYKNIILFIGIMFSGNILNFSLYPIIFLAFFLVSLTSSINYIANDILDLEADKTHPEKMKNRPNCQICGEPQAALVYVMGKAVCGKCVLAARDRAKTRAEREWDEIKKLRQKAHTELEKQNQ